MTLPEDQQSEGRQDALMPMSGAQPLPARDQLCPTERPTECPKTLGELVAGDQVCVSSGGWQSNERIDTIVKVTKTQIVLKQDARYNRGTGYRCGETGNCYGGRSRLVVVTPEITERILRRKLVQYFTGMRQEELEKLSTRALQSMHTLATNQE